jgi:exopolysaccharide biosynthesis WecB/TagA/CpsF family protein
VHHLLDQPGKKLTAAFVNAHCVNVAAKDNSYARALRQADLLLPDGAGMGLAAKMTGQKLVENLNGTDLCEPLCREAAARGKSVYLLGARPGVAVDAAHKLLRTIPGLRIAGVQHGYFGKDETDDVIAEINRSGADIVMVAMGVPMQDLWIYDNRDALDASLVMGVGALFDFLAERVQRAPAIVRRAKMEWAWRLGLEPVRMFRRYVLGNPAFVGRALLNAQSLRFAGQPAMVQ